DRAEPAEWAARLNSLTSLLTVPRVPDGITHEQAYLHRSRAAAVRAWREAVESTAELLQGSGRIALGEFWKRVESAAAMTPLRVEDGRRNVVHVLDVYEARQWLAPVVFVCGLVERHFPQYAREDALLSDSVRRRLGLRTSLDRQHEEKLL